MPSKNSLVSAYTSLSGLNLTNTFFLDVRRFHQLMICCMTDTIIGALNRLIIYDHTSSDILIRLDANAGGGYNENTVVMRRWGVWMFGGCGSNPVNPSRMVWPFETESIRVEAAAAGAGIRTRVEVTGIALDDY